jgi:hypothetical protein
MFAAHFEPVMAGLVPAIHVLAKEVRRGCPDKAEHDE